MQTALPSSSAASGFAGARTAEAESAAADTESSDAAQAVAMVWRGRGLPHTVEHVALPAPGPGEVLVAVELSTICGSDLHTVHGRRAAPAPLVLGHESVGRVVAVGEGGAGAGVGNGLRSGDRVVWSVAASCGSCDRCDGGVPQKCRELVKYGHVGFAPGSELSGGFASHLLLRQGTPIVRVDDSLPAATLAPVSCATATAWAAVERAASVRPLHGARVHVHGAGLVGLSAAAIAAARGAEVTVFDPSPGRRARAERFGAAAAEVRSTRAEPPAAGSADSTGGMDAHPREAEVVIEASGHAVSTALETAAVGGVVVLVGSVFPAPPVPLDAERVVRRLLTLSGVHNYTGEHLAGAARFVERHAADLPFAELVGPPLPLGDLDDALEAASAPDAPLRVAVRP